jgi:XTP/dITP diphosphohydrolase
MKIVLASGNQGKLKEFNQLFSNTSFEIVTQSDLGVKDVEETGLSFIENAILKARHASAVTGLPALADDSGLVVNALNGAPGIYSARYAGEKAGSMENIAKLLTVLGEQPDRDAHFHCVLAFLTHANDPAPLICEGKWFGKILLAPQGEKGFGYDPIFYCSQTKQSAAELSPEIKNKISHRGLALKLLLQSLPEKLCTLSQSAN